MPLENRFQVGGIPVDHMGIIRINLMERQPSPARYDKIQASIHCFTMLLKMAPLLAQIDDAVDNFHYFRTEHQKVRVIIGRDIIESHLAQPVDLAPEQWGLFYQSFTYHAQQIQLVGWADGLTVIPEQ